MLIVRFKARCLPDKTEEVLEAMTAIIAPVEQCRASSTSTLVATSQTPTR